MRQGLSYGDVLLVPKKTQVSSRKDVNLETRLTRNISLNIPIISANMDTVTETHMAIAMAQVGGIGIIHRFMSINDQVEMVEKVKRAENKIIHEPYTLQKHQTIRDVLDLAKRTGVDGFLVVDDEKKLEGIISARDYAFVHDYSTKIEGIMTPRAQLHVADHIVSQEEAEEFFQVYVVEKLPIVNQNNELVGLITAKDCAKVRTHKRSAKDVSGRFLVGAAIGIKEDYFDRAVALTDAGCDVLVVDVAHGHSDYVIGAIEHLKSVISRLELIAGNVATCQGTLDLIAAGADAVKVGVGPGSMCSTRLVTGAGVPQFTAIQDCAEAGRKYGIPIIADGGIVYPGDIVKALAAGAESVMIGSLFAGTTESPGELLNRGGIQSKLYRGMASLGAALSKMRVDGREADINEITPEGVEKLVPYQGSAKDIIKKLVGGVLSGISYGGASNIADLQANAEWIQITSAGYRESTPHGQ